MKNLQITITLESTAQLEGLEAALSLYVDMEGERRKDAQRNYASTPNASKFSKDWTQEDERRFLGAQAALKTINQ